jgi:phage gp29-like protein
MASIIKRIFGRSEPAPPALPPASSWPDQAPYVLRESDILKPPLPIEPAAGTQYIARPPIIDRYPIIIGQNLNGQNLSATYRVCLTGWRYQLVDILNELLEHDGHARGVVRQRILSVACGRIEVHPPRLRKDHPKADLAKEAADILAEQIDSIPNFTQAIAQLQWGVIYGISASEINWNFSAQDGWEPVGLSHIHSRRLNYPDPSTWDLYIYDQGLVGPGLNAFGPTVGMLGLRVGNYPGKFITHVPALNADYPTRDGEGRYIGFLMLLKRMIVRASAQDFERVVRPWVLGYFNRDADENGKPPAATPEDQTQLQNALKAFGLGSLNAASLPNTVKVELLKAISAMSAVEFLSYLNREMSKALLGQSFTTEPGANGNFATAEVAERGTLKISRYDGRCLADSLESGLARPWFRLRYPSESVKLAPRVKIMVDELPSPKDKMDLAVKGTSINMPLAVQSLADDTGLTLVSSPDEARTGMLAAGKGPTPAATEQEQQEADELAARAAAAAQAARQGNADNGEDEEDDDNAENGENNEE